MTPHALMHARIYVHTIRIALRLTHGKELLCSGRTRIRQCEWQYSLNTGHHTPVHKTVCYVTTVLPSWWWKAALSHSDSCFFKIRFNIIFPFSSSLLLQPGTGLDRLTMFIFPSTCRFYKQSVFVRFPNKNFLIISFYFSAYFILHHSIN